MCITHSHWKGHSPMSMNTFFAGRLRNTPLPRTHGLLPLFEAVVNSIQAVAAARLPVGAGEIVVEIERAAQQMPLLEGTCRRQDAVTGFRVRDNGCGFDDANLRSFETLDSDFEASEGCRGVGRLLWLKAFDAVEVSSDFRGPDDMPLRRSFAFSATSGVEGLTMSPSPSPASRTEVHLSGFRKEYSERAPKTARTIANDLLAHCLWYFVRDGGAPAIKVVDQDETILLDALYGAYMHASAHKQSITIKGHPFELTHLKLKASAPRDPFIAWCAAGRVVKEEGIVGKVAGLHGRLTGDEGDFLYACYLTSPFLDQHVRPERIDFDIEEINDGLFAATELSLSEIRTAILESSKEFLARYLQESCAAGRERIESFVAQRAPRYRPILGRISEEKLGVDPSISDRDLDLLLHKHLSEMRSSLLASIVVIEIKRPMRNDAASGEDKDPIEQVLGYLDRIRNGQTQTASGRPIPRSDEIPGFCYVVCDITPSVERRCKLAQLTVTSDRQGYFGYNANYRAYIEVVSFDRLLNGARERNRAFFDKLGLPAG